MFKILPNTKKIIKRLPWTFKKNRNFFPNLATPYKGNFSIEYVLCSNPYTLILTISHPTRTNTHSKSLS